MVQRLYPVRAPETLWMRVKLAAGASGMTVAEFIRQALADAAERVLLVQNDADNS